MATEVLQVSVPTEETKAHALQCLEVWGGNRWADDAISVHGIDAWVLSVPWAGAESGGDIYYASMCGFGWVSRFAIADVVGHGPTADHLASELRALMRKHIGQLDQAAFAKALNGEFNRAAGGGAYATALLTTYFAPTDHLVVCNAGHPPPFWYRADRQAWEVLRPDAPGCLERFRNLPLGIIEATDFVQYAIRLERDDLIVLCTDSQCESRDPQDRMLGEEGMLNLLRGLDPHRPEHLGHALVAAVDSYRGHRPVEDDVTVMVLRHNAGNPPPLSIGQMIKLAGIMIGVIRE